jgi:hypothetical protein
MRHYLSHPQSVLWGCFSVYGTKGVRDLRGERNIFRTVVILIISLAVEELRIRALAHTGGLRTAFARKLLWPWGRMRSLEEPALIAELRSFQKKIIQSDPVKRTNFPGLSVERRHVIV